MWWFSWCSSHHKKRTRIMIRRIYIVNTFFEQNFKFRYKHNLDVDADKYTWVPRYLRSRGFIRTRKTYNARFIISDPFKSWIEFLWFLFTSHRTVP